jgi:hypothetical protein
MSRVLRKCQFTEPNERQLLGTKMTKEITQLDEWFNNMSINIGDVKVRPNNLI